jgi:hypothetical protein
MPREQPIGRDGSKPSWRGHQEAGWRQAGGLNVSVDDKKGDPITAPPDASGLSPPVFT